MNLKYEYIHGLDITRTTAVIVVTTVPTGGNFLPFPHNPYKFSKSQHSQRRSTKKKLYAGCGDGRDSPSVVGTAVIAIMNME